MKKLLMILTLMGVLPLNMLAQDDDMYFVPTKENKAKEAESYGLPTHTYYAGSNRSVDEYNRYNMTGVVAKDSVGNDIIDFSAVRGVYPDSVAADGGEGDYELTRRMTRFDDYTPSQAYWAGYRDGRWMSPWYYNSWYSWYDYDMWYWDNPYYYSSLYGWYSPWYYGYYGYRPWYHYGYYGYYGYRPWNYGYIGYYYGGGRGGGSHHRDVRPRNHRPALHGSDYGGYRGNSSRNSNTNTNRGASYGGTRSNSTTGGSFGGSRGGSFGGGGGSFGGGGGHSGGGRSASGGRSFGGRK